MPNRDPNIVERDNTNPDPDNPGNGDSATINVRSPGYFIARTAGTCAHCGSRTRLIGLLLPPSHETLSFAADDADAPEADFWDQVPYSAFLFYVGCVPDEVRRRLEGFSNSYRPAASSAVHGTYWANHCEHCGALQEDHDLFCEPEGAFHPVDAASAIAIELTHVSERFEAAAGGYACEPQYLEYTMRA